MKNINFAPDPQKNRGGVGGKPFFIIIGLFLLILLYVIYVIQTTPFGEKWIYMFDKEVNTQVLIKKQDIAEKKIHINEDNAGKEALFEQTKNKGEKQEVKKIEKKKENRAEPDSDNNYIMQVCSCVIKENADNIFMKLGDLGYFPVVKQDLGQANMYNIYSEILGNKYEATGLLSKLKDDGFEPALISLPDGSFSIRIAKCYYRQSTDSILNKLNSLGYRVRMLNELTWTKMYTVLLGGFKSMSEAEATREILVQYGYNALILRR